MESGAESLLRSGIAALRIPLDDSVVNSLLRYIDLLIKWNQTYNLTAIRTSNDIVTHHILDSLAIVSPLQQLTSKTQLRLLDVGSGAGLPGAIIAMACPEWQVTCIDAVQKKIRFLQHVIGTLGLVNLSARHGRIEQVAEPFDVITARAFATLAQFTAQSRRALAPGGVWCAMKGKYPEDEVKALDPDVQLFHVEQLKVPGLDADRCLICMRPAATLAPSMATN